MQRFVKRKLKSPVTIIIPAMTIVESARRLFEFSFRLQLDATFRQKFIQQIGRAFA